MYHIKEISYEEARKEYFDNLLVHTTNKLAYWLREHDHYKCSELGLEINFIEDAIKALNKEDEQSDSLTTVCTGQMSR